MKRLVELKATSGKTIKSSTIEDKGVDIGRPIVKILFDDDPFIEIASDGYDDSSVELWVVQGKSDGAGGIM